MNDAADELAVRPAGESDLPAVLALIAEGSRSPEPTDGPTARQQTAFAEIVRDAHQDLLVGVLGEQVVCTAQVTWLRVLSGDGALYCQVENVRTRSDVRGRGIGTLLLQGIEHEARRRGAARLQLTSHLSRDRAHAFYARLGFEPSHVGMKKPLT